MSRYILIRRLRGPAILLLIGVTALLHQMGVVEHWMRLFVPLLLILLGVLLLAERTALVTDASGLPPYPGSPYPGAPYAGQVDPNMAPGATESNVRETGIVRSSDFSDGPNGGKL